MTTLGAKIKSHRKKMGLTQTQLEKKAGLALGVVSRVENGIINPSKETIRKIAEILKLKDLAMMSLFDIEVNFIREFAGILNIIHKIDSQKSFQKNIQNVINSIADKFDYDNVVILRYKEGVISGDYMYENNEADGIMNLMGAKFQKLVLNEVDFENNFIYKTINEETIYESDSIYNYGAGFIPVQILKKISKLIKFERALSIPLVHEGKKLGVIYFQKKYHTDYGHELPILRVLAEEISKIYYFYRD